MSFHETLPPGTIVAERYEILSQLGEGGFAVVYKARQLHIGRLVAIKVMNRSLIEEFGDLKFEERFAREAQSAAKIRHPNVVMIYDFGLFGEECSPYLSMEYLEGHDLQAELNLHGPMSFERAARLFLPCLDALGMGHRLDIIHRDLKPSNLFLCNPHQADESLTILDFGMAALELSTAEAANRLTTPGMMMGTPHYSAPENILQGLVSPALDVYQAALVFIEALTGKTVVEARSVTECLEIHVKGLLEIPSIVSWEPLFSVLMKALEPNHLKRYPDANAFKTDLAAVMGNSNLGEGSLSIFHREESSIRKRSISPSFSSKLGLRLDSNPEDLHGDSIWVVPERLALHEQLLAQGDPLAAYIWASNLARTPAEVQVASRLVGRLRTQLMLTALERVEPHDRLPRLLIPIDDVVYVVGLEPRAGFLLGMMNDELTIEGLLRLNFLPPEEVALLLLTLEHRGVIELQA